jgi:arylsulfatase A-like enzyme
MRRPVASAELALPGALALPGLLAPLLLLLLVLLRLLPLVGCGELGERGGSIRHVVIVVLDATNAAHAGCYGGPDEATPNLDALARRGVRFEQAYSNSTWTLPSTVSLLSGRLPERHGVVRAADAVPPDLSLLSERLALAGYRSASFVQMIFASDRHGLDRGFDTFRYVRPNDEGLAELRAGVRAFLAERGERSSLLYVHLRRPHSPYDPPEGMLAPFVGAHPLADGGRDAALRSIDNAADPQLDALERERLVQLYRGGLRAADAELGWLLPLLDTEQDTLLIVTSDHGEGLGEHGDYGHGRGLHAEHVHVPLVMVGPGLTPRTVREPVCTVDLVPTVLELTGQPGVPGLDGISLVPLLRGAAPAARRAPLSIATRRYAGETVSAAIVDGPLYVLRGPAGATSVYDVFADPGQAQDLAARRPEALERWNAALDALQLWEPGRSGPGSHAAPGDEEDLRALGYVR